MKQSEEILSELEELGSKLGNIPKQMPFAIPENYLEDFKKNLLFEIDSKSVELDAISKEMPLECPTNYFENLPNQILESIHEKERKQIKIISFKVNIWTKIRIAAAAVLLIALGFSVFQYIQYHNSFEHKIAALPQKEVKEYVQQKMLDISNVENIATASEKLPKELTDQEIKQYLNETGWE